MTLIQRLMASCGIGAADLTLIVEEQFHPRGSDIHGTVRLIGGEIVQRVESVTVSLIQYANSGKYEHRLLDCKPVGTVNVLAQGKQEFDFKLEIPDDAFLTQGNSFARDHQQSAYLAADADIRWAVNPRARLELNIFPHREVTAVWEAMRLVGLVKQPDGMINAMSNSGASAAWDAARHASNSISNTYDPPPSLREQMDYVTLTLAVQHGEVVGRWMLNYTPHNLKQRLSSLAGHERHEAAFRIPCGDLRDRYGNPNPAGAVPVLELLLKQALMLPGNEQAWLLRGSQAPADAPDVLLRPAESGAVTAKEELLRPQSEALAPKEGPVW